MDYVFQLLNKSPEAFYIYEEWVNELDKENISIDKSVREYSSINLADSSQKYFLLYPLFKKHQSVINFWLSEFLFPKEAKEFQSRLSMSAWDLCEMNKNLVVGFSGTNDSRFLLPSSMNYYDIPDLIGTSGKVVSNLINKNKSPYKIYNSFPEKTNEIKILEEITVDTIRVLLDVGALIIKMSNREVAKKWLELYQQNNRIEAIVYFEDNDLVVLDKSSRQTTPYEMSIYKHKLDKCLIYLDESHCRGTDLT